MSEPPYDPATAPIRLQVIPRPASGTRCNIVADGVTGPLLIGTVTTAPSFACGRCGNVLVRGIHANQLQKATNPSHRLPTGRPSIELRAWDMTIAEAVTVPTPDLVILYHGDGPLVLTCGRCAASNQVPAPSEPAVH